MFFTCQVLHGINYHNKILKLGKGDLDDMVAFETNGSWQASVELQQAVKYARRCLDDVHYILNKFDSDLGRFIQRRKTAKATMSSQTVGLLMDVDDDEDGVSAMASLQVGS